MQRMFLTVPSFPVRIMEVKRHFILSIMTPRNLVLQSILIIIIKKNYNATFCFVNTWKIPTMEIPNAKYNNYNNKENKKKQKSY